MKEDVTLVIRLSAPGDVAMTLPVARSAASHGKKLVVLTRGFAAGFFENIEGITIIKADTEGVHSGLPGLIRLAREISQLYRVRDVVDLHDVLRSRFISLLFRISGAKISRIDKGRREKRRLVKGRVRKGLQHSIERYADTFRHAGYDNIHPVIPAFELTVAEQSAADNALKTLSGKGGRRYIGVAPFSRHRMKTWGRDKIIDLLKRLGGDSHTHFVLFGSRDEYAELEQISASIENAIILPQSAGIRIELAIISRLEYMITMDSLNMHLAALSSIPTVSIWGGTHPFAGFFAWGQDENLSLGIPESQLDCRPCSVFGSGKCHRTDVQFKCLVDLTPEIVYNGIIRAGLH